MGDMGYGDQPALRRLPDKGVAIGQGGAKRGGRQAIQRRGDAGKKGRLAFAILVFCHANPLFLHGCKGGLGRYSPRPAAPESSRYKNKKSAMLDTQTLVVQVIDLLLSFLWGA